MELKVTRAKAIKGRVRVPGDKSISHRAVMLGSLAQGVTKVSHFLMGADCLSTIECFRAMGVEFAQGGDDMLIISGLGLRGLKEPTDVLNAGNSGTTIRLMTGILAGQDFFAAITGDESIRRRPMGRVTGPLLEMGASIAGRQGGKMAPLAIQGRQLKPVTYSSPVASAQVKSAVLLAGLFADGRTTVVEPEKSRDHTERMLAYLGGHVEVDGLSVTVTGNPVLTGRPVEVPGDISSAAFFMVAASVVPGSELTIERVGLNPTRTGIIDALQAMGADISVVNEETVNGEPLGDIVVRSSGLKGTTIGGALIPRLIDEIPVLAVAAALAEGETVICDAAELKVKETNRISTMAGELRKVGGEVQELDDGLVIRGGRPLHGALCQSHQDHRVAMAMAVAGLAANGETVIDDAGCVDISFPGFAQLLKSVIK